MAKGIMVKKLLIGSLTIFSLSFGVTSCQTGYESKDGKVYHKWINGGSWTMEKILMKNADAASFQTIDHNLNIDLGKDKNYVFIGSAVLEHADPNTFAQVKEYYWKDKDHVYLLQFGGPDYIVKYADPKTFTVIKDYLWAKDGNNVYYQFDKLPGVDPNYFNAIDENWGKDDRYYYWNNLRVDSLIYNSAEIISSYYIKDKSNVFFENKVIKDADPSTFKADGVGWFGHDNKYMFDHEENKGAITEKYRKTYIEGK
ncbi:DKNYY domain-containing protein [Ferruginibacter albus]|uniref:DKNYY domain-containing protein n=1 Tax=Ferruginibacter albus TaxID=2875540 RepID=UPI001CC58AE4|nr:DKNYY domain-containing protein [Ferruginibacter albus]UAY50869.1 DKNYY domain-containing protein [Ferruginibacter albus]